MNAAPDELSRRLDEIRARIDRATVRSGRRPGEVVLLAVVKQVPVLTVQEAVVLGVSDLGESRVQEAQLHASTLVGAPVRWHLIGHLQRNKAGRAVAMFDRIHSLDDAELARSLSRLAVEAGRTLPVLIEVDVAGESTKFGVAPGRLPVLIEEIAGLPGLSLDGLMMVGPAVEDPELARPGFVRLRELRDRAEGVSGRKLPELSMGMSADFDVAVEEGATVVRIGSALFGARV